MNPSRSVRKLALALSSAMAAGSFLPMASAANVTWSGNTDANLGTSTNWAADLGPAPVSGDSWTFGAPGTAGANLANNLSTSSSFEVAGITFASTATTAYTIDSAHAGAFALTGNITMTGGSVDQTIGSNITVSGSRTVTLNSGGTAGGNLILTGNLGGSGTLTQAAQGTAAKSINLQGDNSGFTGAFIQNNDSANRTAFAVASAGSASAAWTFNRNVNGGVALNFTGSTIKFGALSGGGNIRANNTGTVTVEVGALATDTTFSGIFQQANTGSILAVKKVGAGTLTLSGNSSHLGGVTVEAGKLVLGNATNSIGTGALNVTGGTIGGSGKGVTTTANTTYTINGGRVAPGAITTASNFGGVGTLTLTSTGTGSGINFTSASFDFDLASTAAGVSDQLALGASALNYGSLGFSFSGTALETGTAYTLFTSSGTVSGFNAGSISSTFLGGLSGQYAAVYSLSGGSTGNLLVTFSAIPEPSSFAMVAGAAVLGCVGLRRRRRG